MAKHREQKGKTGCALAMERELLATADKMRRQMDVVEYKHVADGPLAVRPCPLRCTHC